jgi:hypothetical protein
MMRLNWREPLFGEAKRLVADKSTEALSFRDEKAWALRFSICWPSSSNVKTAPKRGHAVQVSFSGILPWVGLWPLTRQEGQVHNRLTVITSILRKLGQLTLREAQAHGFLGRGRH